MGDITEPTAASSGMVHDLREMLEGWKELRGGTPRWKEEFGSKSKVRGLLASHWDHGSWEKPRELCLRS